MSRISERILEALRIRNMSQAELSEATGIGKSSISMYLSDKYEPKRRNLEKMAAALDVNPAWLGGDDAPMEARNVEARMFAQRLSHFMETQGRGPADMAALLGVKESQISQWLRGIDVAYIPIDDIAVLGDDLDVSPAYLMGWTDDPIYYEKLKITVPTWFDGSKKSYLKHQEIVQQLEKTIAQGAWAVPLTTAYEAAEVPRREAACDVLRIPYVNPEKPAWGTSAAAQTGVASFVPRTVDMIVYDYPAAAGLPLYAESDFERISFLEDEVPPSADFGIRISGDSMEPTIPDGSIVWVHKQLDIRDGEVGIFMLDDNAVCKRARLRPDARLICLESDNPKYKPITGAALIGVRCVGKVLNAPCASVSSDMVQTTPLYVKPAGFIKHAAFGGNGAEVKPVTQEQIDREKEFLRKKGLLKEEQE